MHCLCMGAGMGVHVGTLCVGARARPQMWGPRTIHFGLCFETGSLSGLDLMNCTGKAGWLASVSVPGLGFQGTHQAIFSYMGTWDGKLGLYPCKASTFPNQRSPQFLRPCIFFYFKLFMCVSVIMFVYNHVSDALEMELQVVVSGPARALGTQLQPVEDQKNILNS